MADQSIVIFGAGKIGRSFIGQLFGKSGYEVIFRVGSDLQRKLGPDDRFMATIRLAMKKKVPYGMILEAMSMGFYFNAKDEKEQMFPGDVDFHKRVSGNLNEVLEQICGLHASSDFQLISQLKKQIDKLSHHNA